MISEVCMGPPPNFGAGPFLDFPLEPNAKSRKPRRGVSNAETRRNTSQPRTERKLTAEQIRDRNLRKGFLRKLIRYRANWPEMPNSFADRLIKAQIGNVCLATEFPDVIGRLVRLTRKERLELKLWPIFNYDQTLDDIFLERDKRKASAKMKERDAAKLLEGKPIIRRAAYEAASFSKTRPWEELGVSKRTWERGRKSGRFLTQVRTEE